MDKNGVALGNLVIGQGEARHDYCIDLLKAGMAHCDERAVDRMGAAGQALTAAEASARASKIGIWSADVEAANAKKRGTAAAAAQDTAAHDDAPIAGELLPVRLSQELLLYRSGHCYCMVAAVVR
eukprot:6299-Heterococcus_DN1.PRE.3